MPKVTKLTTNVLKQIQQISYLSKTHKNFVMLIGNIGSGKTTLVKELCKHNYLAVSRDAIRYMLGGGNYLFGGTTEPVVLNLSVHALKVLVEAGMLNIVFDEVCMKERVRAKYLRLVKGMGYNIIAVVMPTVSRSVSVKRRLSSPHGEGNRELWNGIWDRFDNGYEAPSKAEGFTHIINL